jgi:hypothetical protein
MKLAAIAFHVDSLNEAYDFPEGYRDPTFHEIGERFMKLADEYQFRATCFVIGRDLLKKDQQKSVQGWAKKGHEIASHSFSHLYNLGSLSEAAIREEISRAQQEIVKAVGVSPKGFVSPNWSASPRLLKIVQEMGYSYDASLFPSWLRVPATVKMYLNCLQAGNGRAFRIINQNNFGYSLWGSRQPKVVNDLVLLPLPANRYRIGTWHTLSFMFGQNTHERILKSALADTEFFYYVLHPADIMDPKEVDPSRPTNLARLDVSLEKKMTMIRRSLDIITQDGRRLVTMSELAQAAKARLETSATDLRQAS